MASALICIKRLKVGNAADISGDGIDSARSAYISPGRHACALSPCCSMHARRPASFPAQPRVFFGLAQVTPRPGSRANLPRSCCLVSPALPLARAAARAARALLVLRFDVRARAERLLQLAAR